jgi:hypothetical protein
VILRAPLLPGVLKLFYDTFTRAALEQPTVVLLWGRPLASWLLALGERGGHEELSCIMHKPALPGPFSFLTPWKWRLPKPFITQGRTAIMSPQGPTGGPAVGEPYTVGHNGQE